MATSEDSVQPAYFEAIYAADPDPWHYTTSAYEAAKYDATLGALPRSRYRTGLEVGCSIGVLTAQLATRCDRLLAIDVVDSALEQARSRCGGLPWVQFARMQVPSELPGGCFDLLVLSEVLYYFRPADLQRLAIFAERAVAPGGDILLVNWTGPTGHPLSGDEACACFLEAASGFTDVLRRERSEGYRLDLVRRMARMGR
jgi:SAM-dependent methyltransferase